MDNPVILGLMFFCAIMGLIGFYLGLKAIIEVEAYKRSTHKIEWREVSPEQVKSELKQTPSIDGDDEDEMYEEGAFSKQWKEYQENLEDSLL